MMMMTEVERGNKNNQDDTMQKLLYITGRWQVKCQTVYLLKGTKDHNILFISQPCRQMSMRSVYTREKLITETCVRPTTVLS